MSYWGWDGPYYPKPKPRRPANGIKAQSGTKFGKTWWASQWLKALERLVDPKRLSRGRSYARSGQVLNIDIQPGQVLSRVQGSRPQPYRVRIDVKPLTDKEWERVVRAMAEQAIFAAKLLAGEMPPNIEEAFAAAKANLFPGSRGDLQTECSCPDWSNPCKHIAAVYYLLGEQFDADPFLLFRLRGKGKDELLTMLRAKRAAAGPIHPPAEETARPEREPEEPTVPLQTCLERFWDTSDHLEDFPLRIKGPDVDAIPVKRLGTPGFWRGDKVDYAALFSDAYQAITKAALTAAFGNEG